MVLDCSGQVLDLNLTEIRFYDLKPAFLMENSIQTTPQRRLELKELRNCFHKYLITAVFVCSIIYVLPLEVMPH